MKIETMARVSFIVAGSIPEYLANSIAFSSHGPLRIRPLLCIGISNGRNDRTHSARSSVTSTPGAIRCKPLQVGHLSPKLRIVPQKSGNFPECRFPGIIEVTTH